MTINKDGATPLYQQLAAILRDRIAKKEIAPGTRIPSETALESEFDLARGTVRAAIELLKSEGLVVSVQGRGTFAVEAAPDAKGERA